MQVIGRGGGKRGQVFGAQWLLWVWQSRERRRAQLVCWNCCIHKLPLGEAESSLTWTASFVKSHRYQTSYLSKSDLVRSFRGCSPWRSCSTLLQCWHKWSSVHTASAAPFRWYIIIREQEKIYWPVLSFLCGVCYLSHSEITQTLSGNCVHTLSLFALTNKQSLREIEFIEVEFKTQTAVLFRWRSTGHSRRWISNEQFFNLPAECSSSHKPS